MKKLLGILVLGLLWCSNVNAETATCIAGECMFSLNIWYEWAETLCMQRLVNEEVIVRIMSFEIVETGQHCMVFNER